MRSAIDLGVRLDLLVTLLPTFNSGGGADLLKESRTTNRESTPPGPPVYLEHIPSAIIMQRALLDVLEPEGLMRPVRR